MELPRLGKRPLHAAASPSVLLDVQSDIADALVYFHSLGEIFLLGGMALTGIGFLAWATNKKRNYRHQWGKRIFGMGIVFTIIGFNFGGFLSLVYFLLGQ